MAKKTYVGVSNVARKVSKMYVGVNGVARKVKKAYIGVNGIAQEFYTTLPKIVTWAGGTDAEIVAMIESADKGLINLSDYWSVGDERVVSLSAMSASYVAESHVAQSIRLVLMNAGGKKLYTATESGRTTCSFIVGMKDCLDEKGYINRTNTNVGGWDSCARRTWCNNTFKGAIPSTLLSIFKRVKNKTSAGNQSSTIVTSNDWFAFPSEIEVHNTRTNSYAGEGTQFTWYATASNKIKKKEGVNAYYWERSPVSINNNFFTLVYDNGNPNGGYYANGDTGISVFGAI